MAPTPNDVEEYYHILSINNIRAISYLKKTKQYENFDITEEVLPTNMINFCINTLNSDAMTPEKESLGYFICKKLKNLKTWKE